MEITLLAARFCICNGQFIPPTKLSVCNQFGYYGVYDLEETQPSGAGVWWGGGFRGGRATRKKGISHFARSPENFCGFFFECAREVCIEKWRGFSVNFFLVSVSHE